MKEEVLSDLVACGIIFLCHWHSKFGTWFLVVAVARQPKRQEANAQIRRGTYTSREIQKIARIDIVVRDKTVVDLSDN